MDNQSKKPFLYKHPKIFVGIIILGMIIMAILSSLGDSIFSNNKSQINETKNNPTKIKEEVSTAIPSITIVPTSIAINSIDNFPELKAALSGNNNDGKPYLRSYIYNVNTKYLSLDINVDTDKYPDFNLLVLRDLSKYIEQIYPNYSNKIDKLVISLYVPLVDKYGNTTDDKVYILSLGNNTASKLNWKLKDSPSTKDYFETKILPQNWDIIYNFKSTLKVN